MTNEQLAEIKARANEATKGPWQTQEGFNKTEIVDAEHGGIGSAWVQADARFIAHSRQDIPDLSLEVERLKEENEYLKEEVVCSEQESKEIETIVLSAVRRFGGREVVMGKPIEEQLAYVLHGSKLVIDKQASEIERLQVRIAEIEMQRGES